MESRPKDLGSMYTRFIGSGFAFLAIGLILAIAPMITNV